MATTNTPDRPAAKQEEDDPTSRMSFFDHLEELRRRILYSLLAIGIGMGVGLYYSGYAYDFLARPMNHALQTVNLGSNKMIFTSPLGPIRLYLSVGLYFGIVIALPFVLHQVWLFVAPGLYRHERRASFSFLVSSLFLFFAGTAFGYVVLLPITLEFLLKVGANFTPLISINDYFDLVLVILLGLGIVFQLPILIFFLSLFGIVTPRFLLRNFRYAILLIAIVAAVVTPTTDPITMIVFMVPMIVLYAVGIGVSFLVGRKKTGEGEPKAAGAAVYYLMLALLGLGAAVAVLWWAWRHFGWRMPW